MNAPETLHAWPDFDGWMTGQWSVNTYDSKIAVKYTRTDSMTDPMSDSRVVVLVEAARLALNEMYAPEPNCSCHINPPCGDCVEHNGVREVIFLLKTAIAAMETKNDRR